MIQIIDNCLEDFSDFKNTSLISIYKDQIHEDYKYTDICSIPMPWGIQWSILNKFGKCSMDYSFLRAYREKNSKPSTWIHNDGNEGDIMAILFINSTSIPQDDGL